MTQKYKLLPLLIIVLGFIVAGSMLLLFKHAAEEDDQARLELNAKIYTGRIRLPRPASLPFAG